MPQLNEDEVWDNVTFGYEPHLVFEDGHWHVRTENECSWEEEHGLQLVFTDGNDLTRISGYDDFLTD